MKKEKILVVALVIIFVGYAAYAFFRSKNEEKKLEKEAVEKASEAFPRLCEAGGWIAVSKGSTNSKGEPYQAKTKLASKDGIWEDEKGENIFISSPDIPFDYFSGKEVELNGVKTGQKDNKEVFVNKLRCAGIESNKELFANRRKLMDYVSKNINTLSDIKAQAGWKVEAFYFVSESDFYVEYASVENNREIMQWLARASKFKRSKPVIESLAYFKIDPDSRKKELIKGEDSQKRDANLSKYIFNPTAKKWEIQS